MRTQADVLELLVKLASLDCAHTDLSDESAKTLWDAKDNVLLREETAADARANGSRDAVYVILRHFTTDGFGTHVGLASAVRKHKGGEVHEYRMPAATLAAERVGVYVYNPGVYANGTLRFAVDSCSVVVPPDTCPQVHTLAAADMQQTRTVVLTEETRRYSISLSFFFVHGEQPEKNENALRTARKK